MFLFHYKRRREEERRRRVTWWARLSPWKLLFDWLQNQQLTNKKHSHEQKHGGLTTALSSNQRPHLSYDVMRGWGLNGGHFERFITSISRLISWINWNVICLNEALFSKLKDWWRCCCAQSRELSVGGGAAVGGWRSCCQWVEVWSHLRPHCPSLIHFKETTTWIWMFGK